MDENTVNIIIAIIGLIGTLIGCFSTYLVTSKKHAVQEAMREQNQQDLFDNLLYELENVKKRLDEHNNYAEKITSIEKSIISIKKDVEYIRKDIK